MTDTPTLAVLRLFRARSFLESRLAPELGSVHGVGLNELLLLMQLTQAPLQRLRRVDLAARLSVSQSTVTRMTVPMEKIGLVAREADPRDSRVGYVVLTKSGRTVAANAENIPAHRVRRVPRPLGTERHRHAGRSARTPHRVATW